MPEFAWVKEFPAGIFVCDADGVLLEMNDLARAGQDNPGLIGTNILECHPEPARSKLKEMLASGQANIYTIEKGGIHKLIYQSPWYIDGRYAGFVELELEIPQSMPHFIRD